jgi:hypothetical protein
LINRDTQHGVRAAKALGPIIPGHVWLTERLGEIDARLVVAEAARHAASERARGRGRDREKFDLVMRDLDELNQRVAMAVLWVFGAYEVIRTLDESLGTGQRQLPKSIRNRVTSLKNRFARVRMPLAKLQPEYRHPNEYSIAPVVVRQSIGWRIADRYTVSRRSLSDALLGLLQQLEKRAEATRDGLACR